MQCHWQLLDAASKKKKNPWSNWVFSFTLSWSQLLNSSPKCACGDFENSCFINKIWRLGFDVYHIVLIDSYDWQFACLLLWKATPHSLLLEGHSSRWSKTLKLCSPLKTNEWCHSLLCTFLYVVDSQNINMLQTLSENTNNKRNAPPKLETVTNAKTHAKKINASRKIHWRQVGLRFLHRSCQHTLFSSPLCSQNIFLPKRRRKK